MACFPSPRSPAPLPTLHRPFHATRRSKRPSRPAQSISGAAVRATAWSATAAWQSGGARQLGGEQLRRLNAFADAVNERLPALLLGVMAYAWATPAAFRPFYPASWPGQCALAATMLAVGLTVPLPAFRRALRSPGRVLDGLAIQLAVMPLMALTVCRLVALPLPYAIGCARRGGPCMRPCWNCGAARQPAAWRACMAGLQRSTGDHRPAPPCPPAGSAWWRPALVAAPRAWPASLREATCR